MRNFTEEYQGVERGGGKRVAGTEEEVGHEIRSHKPKSLSAGFHMKGGRNRGKEFLAGSTWNSTENLSEIL